MFHHPDILTHTSRQGVHRRRLSYKQKRKTGLVWNIRVEVNGMTDRGSSAHIAWLFGKTPPSLLFSIQFFVFLIFLIISTVDKGCKIKISRGFSATNEWNQLCWDWNERRTRTAWMHKRGQRVWTEETLWSLSVCRKRVPACSHCFVSKLIWIWRHPLTSPSRKKKKKRLMND